jgi:hypothetical protein
MSDAWSTLREQIEYFSQPFPEAAIAFADAHREEVTSYLVEAITRLADHPEEGANPDYVLHLYAMHLLAAWRETAAVCAAGAARPSLRRGGRPTARRHGDRILRTLPGLGVQWRFGLAEGLVGGSGRRALGAPCGARCHHGAGVRRRASREELIAYLMRWEMPKATLLRQPGRTFKTFELLDSVVSVATDIGAVEMLERIRGWFADELPIRRLPICPGPRHISPAPTRPAATNILDAARAMCAA